MIPRSALGVQQQREARCTAPALAQDTPKSAAVRRWPLGDSPGGFASGER